MPGIGKLFLWLPQGNNAVADALSHTYYDVSFAPSLKKLHDNLCHLGITRLLHYVCSKNMLFSTEEVKEACSSCKIWAELKPQFISSPGQLIKATQLLEQLSLDFKGPLQSSTSNKYLFVAIDEFSRFPFAIPCKDISSKTIIQCLQSIFSLCGAPSYIQSDWGLELLT